MNQKKRKAGRPKLPKADVKQVVAIRLTEAEKREYERRASKSGVGLSDWIRHALQGALLFVFALLLGILAGRASSVVFPTNAQMQKDVDDVMTNHVNVRRRGVILDRNGERILQDQRPDSN